MASCDRENKEQKGTVSSSRVYFSHKGKNEMYAYDIKRKLGWALGFCRGNQEWMKRTNLGGSINFKWIFCSGYEGYIENDILII